MQVKKLNDFCIDIDGKIYPTPVTMSPDLGSTYGVEIRVLDVTLTEDCRSISIRKGIDLILDLGETNRNKVIEKFNNIANLY